MGQRDEFAASSWLVRQAASAGQQQNLLSRKAVKRQRLNHLGTVFYEQARDCLYLWDFRFYVPPLSVWVRGQNSFL
jgi:hypothetical protein